MYIMSVAYHQGKILKCCLNNLVCLKFFKNKIDFKLLLIGTTEANLLQVLKKNYPAVYSRTIKEINNYIECIYLSDLSKLNVK